MFGSIRLFSIVRTIVLLACFLGPVSVVAVAQDSTLAVPGVCYATLGNSGLNAGSLITIAANGVGNLVGPTGIVGQFAEPGVPALGIKTTGEMYAMGIGTTSKLYRIDAFTGTATFVAQTTLSSPPAIAFDGNDVLYAVNSAGSLYTVDDSTGAVVLIGSTGVFLKGLAFEPTGGVLWGSNASGNIYTINQKTAVVMLVGNTGLPASPDIHFDQAGNLRGASGGGLLANNLISIDTATGVGAVVGAIGFPSVSGMAVRLDRVVPATLQAYNAYWTGSHIEITWRLIDIEGTLEFNVFRSAGSGDFVLMFGDAVQGLDGEFVFIDRDVDTEETYRYRVVVFESGEAVTSFETEITTPSMRTSLAQNHPNPFSPTTQISFEIGKVGHVSLLIYDVSGRLVRTLIDRRLRLGPFTEMWDGQEDNGNRVASGIYIYRLRTGNQVLTRKAVLLD